MSQSSDTHYTINISAGDNSVSFASVLVPAEYDGATTTITDATLLAFAKAVNTAVYPTNQSLAITVEKTTVDTTTYSPNGDYSSFA